jgi:hypothetical protein
LCRRPFTVADDTQVVKTRYILQKLDDIPVYCPGMLQCFLPVAPLVQIKKLPSLSAKIPARRVGVASFLLSGPL